MNIQNLMSFFQYGGWLLLIIGLAALNAAFHKVIDGIVHVATARTRARQICQSMKTEESKA